MKIENFIDELYTVASECQELDEFEIYYSRGESFSVKVFQGGIESSKNAKGLGVSLRGIVRGKMGYSSTTKISQNSIHELIAEVLNNGKVLENRDRVEIYPGSSQYVPVENYREDFQEVTPEEKIQFAKDMEEYAKSLDSRVAVVNYSLFQSGKGERVLRNSQGLHLSSSSNSGAAYVSVVVREGEENKTGSAFITGNDIADYDHKKLAIQAVEKALEKLGGTPVATGKYPVIFKSEAFTSLLGSFMGIFSGESVDKGLSLLKGKIGDKISSENFTLVENPFMEKGSSSRGFDDEGVATAYKKIIDGGVLTTYLHNLKTARKFGVQPTGNGFKSSYAGSVGISATNIYVEEGEFTWEEIITKKNEVLILTELAGLHSGLNPVSGDFSLSAEGFLYRDGKMVHPVTQVTVAGNFFQLLKNIEALSDKLEFSMGGIGSPAVLIGELSISGK
ncbi:MAG: TldD/PmbA family protein [Fusobacteriaceae bacterium]